MSLSDWADIARIAASVISAGVLCISFYLAWVVHTWQKESAKANAEFKRSEHLLQYNLLVLNNEEMQDFDAERHSYGPLDRAGVKQMYRYFIAMNAAQGSWQSWKVGAYAFTVSRGIDALKIAFSLKQQGFSVNWVRQIIACKTHDSCVTLKPLKSLLNKEILEKKKLF